MIWSQMAVTSRPSVSLKNRQPLALRPHASVEPAMTAGPATRNLRRRILRALIV
jgi:hypothetical protein